MIRICEDCRRLIEDDAEYTRYTPFRPTTAAPTIYRHKQPCPALRRRTIRTSIPD